MTSEGQRRRAYVCGATPRSLARSEWADRFAKEMQRLGVRAKPETLLDMGLHFWATLRDMSPEDAAEIGAGCSARTSAELVPR